MNGDPKTVDGTCGENLPMESEHEAEIRAALKDEIENRKEQDQRLQDQIDELKRELSEARSVVLELNNEIVDKKDEVADLQDQVNMYEAIRESLTQSLVESNQKLKRSLEALDRLYREGFGTKAAAEALSVLVANGY